MDLASDGPGVSLWGPDISLQHDHITYSLLRKSEGHLMTPAFPCEVSTFLCDMVTLFTSYFLRVKMMDLTPDSLDILLRHGHITSHYMTRIIITFKSLGYR